LSSTLDVDENDDRGLSTSRFLRLHGWTGALSLDDDGDGIVWLLLKIFGTKPAGLGDGSSFLEDLDLVVVLL
jgi:hypothetical protein